MPARRPTADLNVWDDGGAATRSDPAKSRARAPRHPDGEITMSEMIICNNDRWGRAYNLGKDCPIGAPALAR